MQRTGFNNARVRQANKQIFLSHLWREKQLSKSRLAQLSGLSIPAVSNILEELIDEGRICHSRETLSQRGLSSGSYHLPEQGDWTLCMNVTPTSITSQLADARLVAVGDWRHAEINAGSPKALLTALAAHLTPGARLKCLPRALHSAPRTSPYSCARSRFQVDAKALNAGR